MADAHSLSIITIVFGGMLFLLSLVVILDYRDRHRKCHGYYDEVRRDSNGSSDGIVCGSDDVVFASGATLMVAAVVQCFGALPAWYNYWKTWSFFQLVLLLGSAEGLVVPFVIDGLEGFGGPEDIKILALSGFAGVEFLFAFLSLFVMSSLQFQ